MCSISPHHIARDLHPADHTFCSDLKHFIFIHVYCIYIYTLPFLEMTEILPIFDEKKTSQTKDHMPCFNNCFWFTGGPAGNEEAYKKWRQMVNCKLKTMTNGHIRIHNLLCRWSFERIISRLLFLHADSAFMSVCHYQTANMGATPKRTTITGSTAFPWLRTMGTGLSRHFLTLGT